MQSNIYWHATVADLGFYYYETGGGKCVIFLDTEPKKKGGGGGGRIIKSLEFGKWEINEIHAVINTCMFYGVTVETIEGP